jgi:dynein heavy chain
LQDTLDGWIKCQRGWMYLEPIFSSDDIKEKMKTEKGKFDLVDRAWRSAMEIYSKDSNIWETIETDKLKSDFDASNNLLDEIQKSLSEYLETKRRFFPRFYFLSDEELLEILAQTKDPETVQRHINKCFEAISQLQFTKQQHVCAMISAEKEKVDFLKSVDVNEGEKKGNVERWLSEIEAVMIATLKKITKDSLNDPTERVKWVRKWPAQTVLAVNMMRWTEGAEHAIESRTIKEFGGRLVAELKDIVVLVRQ